MGDYVDDDDFDSDIDSINSEDDRHSDLSNDYIEPALPLASSAAKDLPKDAHNLQIKERQQQSSCKERPSSLRQPSSLSSSEASSSSARHKTLESEVGHNP